MAEDAKEPSFIPVDEVDNSKNSSNSSVAMEDVSILTDPLAPSTSLSLDTGEFESTLVFTPATLDDFDEEVPEEEKQFCLQRYKDLSVIKQARMHCTSCNKHLGLTPIYINRLKMHPILRTLMCKECLSFYNSGEFSKGEDGSELYCRWCGQGGQVYCCSSCPIVFCAKCIRRNFGADKIEEIESNDDWNCFVCSPKVLWCHRSALWAARRYCVLKNKYALTKTDPIKRNKVQQECQIDESICCSKRKQKQKLLSEKKVITVKKVEVSKRQASPIRVKKTAIQPIPIKTNLMNTDGEPPPLKKIIVPNTQMKIPIQIHKKLPTFEVSQNLISLKNSTLKMKPKLTQFNGFVPYPFGENSFNTFIPNDHVNLSLDSLTAGIDMSRMLNSEDSVVCTPDLPMPMEPLCDVTEDDDCTEVAFQSDKNANSLSESDDIQCLTPKLPRLVPKPLSALISQTAVTPLLKPSSTPIEIVKMSANDVSVNEQSGALKFKVNPSMLSTNKMYQLPDGRIFAVNSNPNMPGGFSATIISSNQIPSTTADKNVNILPSASQAPMRGIIRRGRGRRRGMPSRGLPLVTKINDLTPKSHEVPKRPTRNSVKTNNKNSDAISNINNSQSIEWYTYNLYDAVDLVDYVSKKLHKIKETPIGNLRFKSIQDIKDMHYSLDQALKISCQRFVEIRMNLTNEFTAWMKEKYSNEELSDDDNVQITSFQNPNMTNNLNEPIFIDENSNDSNIEKDDVIQIVSTVSDITTENEPEVEKSYDEVPIESNKTNKETLGSNVSSEPLLIPDNDMNSIVDESVQDNNLLKSEINDIDKNHIENDVSATEKVKDNNATKEFINDLVKLDNPIVSESAIKSENPILSENSDVSEDPVVSENTAISKNPVATENSVVLESPIMSENLVSGSPNVFENCIESTKSVVSENSAVTLDDIEPNKENNVISKPNNSEDDLSLCENDILSDLNNSKSMDINESANYDNIPENVPC